MRTFLRHPLVVTIVGTGIVTAVAAFLSFRYQIKAAEYERSFENYQIRLKESSELVDHLSKKTSYRLFGLKRTLWAIKGTGTGEAEEVWNDYYKSVEEWNTNLSYYHRRILRLLGEKVASLLVNEADYFDVSTVHGHFIKTHHLVRTLLDCYRNQCPEDESNLRVSEAETSILEMNTLVDNFFKSCDALLFEKE